MNLYSDWSLETRTLHSMVR